MVITLFCIAAVDSFGIQEMVVWIVMSLFITIGMLYPLFSKISVVLYSKVLPQEQTYFKAAIADFHAVAQHVKPQLTGASTRHVQLHQKTWLVDAHSSGEFVIHRTMPVDAAHQSKQVEQGTKQSQIRSQIEQIVDDHMHTRSTKMVLFGSSCPVYSPWNIGCLQQSAE